MLNSGTISRRGALFAALACSGFGLAFAQSAERYGGRLSWVPISGRQSADVAGDGTISASLDRSQLTITGTFAGLPAAAISASLREGVATGARGPEIAELTITRNNAGSISGDVRLSRSQTAALRAGRLYVQVHAERGVEPDNAVLWGWLLAEETTR
jgi:hypothetical protein